MNWLNKKRPCSLKLKIYPLISLTKKSSDSPKIVKRDLRFEYLSKMIKGFIRISKNQNYHLTNYFIFYFLTKGGLTNKPKEYRSTQLQNVMGFPNCPYNISSIIFTN